VERLAYEAALRAMEDQAGELSRLHSQTGTLLTAGSITASFLGAQTIARSGEFGTFGLVALIAFVVSTLAAIYVLLPRTSLVFSLSATVLYDALAGESQPAAHRTIAEWLEDYWDANRSKLRVLVRVFFLSGGALIVEVIFWALALRGTLS
jgi:hypothetical protein